jgi:hypothetical protein
VLGFLELIANTLAQVGALFVWGATEFCNGLFVAVEELFSAVSLASLPEVPAPPSMIEGINWFFPIGSVIAIASSMATAYGSFLLVRWLYKKVGTL